MDVKNGVKIIVEDVSKSFTTNGETRLALDHINFSINQGEFVAILGASGCGKSTLLNMIAGIETCENGRILINDSNLNQPERHRMMMFQESALFPWYSVIENVMYGLRFKRGLDPKTYREIALYYLATVGLKNYADHRVYQLSGGMKQRVALARALAPNPQILLMDEPFSALDASTCEQLYRDLQRIWNSKKKTVVWVTHNVREAIVLAQRILVFSPHPGRIIKEITVDLPLSRTIHDTSVSELHDKIIAILNKK